MAQTDTTNVNVSLVDGMMFVAVAERSQGSMVLDADQAHGGLNAGMRPMEALLAALGSCTSMDAISILRKKRQKVTGFEVHVHGRRAEEYPRRYTHITLEFVVRGFGVDPEAVARSIELSQTKYCGATASLNAEVTYTCRVEEEGQAD